MRRFAKTARPSGSFCTRLINPSPITGAIETRAKRKRPRNSVFAFHKLIHFHSTASLPFTAPLTYSTASVRDLPPKNTMNPLWFCKYVVPRENSTRACFVLFLLVLAIIWGIGVVSIIHTDDVLFSETVVQHTPMQALCSSAILLFNETQAQHTSMQAPYGSEISLPTALQTMAGMAHSANWFLAVAYHA
ncbi:hypothetical protein OPT61_g3295 [Boeremia exigua]|uniref:Uncharacterized protein n=1 Tax=Boeremia exigua TaxID=749465 RepID=A0ACC2IIC5_9PLEO|nr:hypothetical protein OPT61_g3295 [Boeremia exigua]